MTEGERQKLCEDLLLMADAHHYGPLYKRAADAIERLATENGRLTQALIDNLAESQKQLTLVQVDRDQWKFELHK
jgi:hypothetical protein